MSKIKAIGALLHDFYHAPYRAAIAREQRAQDDLFMLMVFSEALGIPNPASYYTLELQAVMLEQLHDWHLRMGLPHSPFDEFRCC